MHASITLRLVVAVLAAWLLPTWIAEPKAIVAAAPLELSGDDRIVHALNRFTFGARPGDVDAVRRLGLDRWFEQQLDPKSIDQADLNRRLARFLALKMDPSAIVCKFPTVSILYMVDKGRLPWPTDPVTRTVYADALARLKRGASPRSVTAAADTALPAGVEEILKLPAGQRLPRLLAKSPAEVDSFFRTLNESHLAMLIAGMTPQDQETTRALQDPTDVVKHELMEQRMLRDVYAPAQLEEVMTDFWLNHFNIYMHKNQEIASYLVSYERDVIRPHALGKFEDLLQATAKSPAMLIYLDNRSSIGPGSETARTLKDRPFSEESPNGLNENYGRELMELHTVGVDGGYTEADVGQVARILTGWTINNMTLGGEFGYDQSRHEPGDKTVMGKRIEAGGVDEGHALLHWLAARPATARYVSRKLCLRFVSDDPPVALVERMAQAYLSHDGDIAAVLRAMFHAPEFWSRNVYRTKFKTPLEFVVSALRASGAELSDPLLLSYVLYAMGMPPYGAEAPNGYSWQSDAWVSAGAMVERLNFAVALSSNQNVAMHLDWSASEGGPRSEAEPLVDPVAEEARLETLLVAGGVGPSTRQGILQALMQQGDGASREEPAASTGVGHRLHTAATHREEDAFVGGLLMGSPEFQRR